MLGDYAALATIAVKDLEAARHFYGDTLGFHETEKSDDEVATYESGESEFVVYQSKFAGGYGATVATWPVDDLEGTVKTLKTKGIDFEHYDMLETTRKGDIHLGGNMKVAWFKDPDGNILCLIEG